jgi:hypothetical protein
MAAEEAAAGAKSANERIDNVVASFKQITTTTLGISLC